jgi:hypothetical protein
MLSILRPSVAPVLRPPFDLRGGGSLGFLFAGGVDGYWRDPSDAATSYTDVTGVSPAIAGQGVALAVDKHSGATPGPEQRATGTLGLVGVADAATYDTVTGAGTATRVDVSNQSYVRFTGPTLASGNTVYATVQNTGVNPVTVRQGAQAGAIKLTVLPGQTITGRFELTAGGVTITAQSSGHVISFIVHSIAQFPGNHATQATAVDRPQLVAVGPYLGDQFDGSTDGLVTTAGGGGSTGFFYCGAFRIDGGAGTARNIFGDTNGLTGYRVHLSAADKLLLSAFDGVAATSAATGESILPGGIGVGMAWDDGVNINVQINNGVVDSVPRPAVVAGSAALMEGRLGSSEHNPCTLFARCYLKGSAPVAEVRQRVKRIIGRSAGLVL